MLYKKVSASIEKLGPGLLLAAMCVGTSHLVHATRAGANYGFALTWLIIFACIIKYPGVRFGSDYAVATDKTLVDAYESQGPWILRAFAILFSVDMLAAPPAIALVTAGITKKALGISYPDFMVVAALLTLCCAILLIGKYKLFESVTKLFVLLFAALTIFAVGAVLIETTELNVSTSLKVDYDKPTILFMIAAAGWMPTAILTSVIQSNWVCAKRKELKSKFDSNTVRFDFNVGYILTVLLALCFVFLGAALMNEQGIVVATNSSDFAGQLIALFTQSTGGASYVLIATTAVVVMFSTLLTILDGFSRTAEKIALQIRSKQSGGNSALNYSFFLILQTMLAIVVILLFLDSFFVFIDLAASLAFFTAPFVAFFNHRAMKSSEISSNFYPSIIMRIWSVGSIFFLALAAVLYAYMRFFT